MLLTKRHMIIFAVCAAALGVTLGAHFSGRGESPVAASARQLPVYSVEREDACISLTFDAAWGAEDTPLLIQALGEHNARATFFVVGEWAEKYPEAVRALHEAGHEVMNHSNTHPHMNSLTAHDVKMEAELAGERIASVTGIKPTLLRVPYGEYNDQVVLTLRESGYQIIQWDVDSLDWKGISADEIVRRVCGKVGKGSIVLFHNAAEHTPEALPVILDRLTEAGYSFVPVSELILKDNYYIDHEGRQCPIKEDEQ